VARDVFNRVYPIPSVITVTNRTPLPPPEVSAVGLTKGVFLSWTPPSESDLSHYEIYRNTANDPNTATKIAEVAYGQSHYTDTGLIPKTEYFYWVKAVDVYNQVSDFSGVGDAEVLPLSISDYNLDQHMISNITWQSSPAAGTIGWVASSPGTSITINFKGEVYTIADGVTDRTYVFWECVFDLS